MQYRNLFITLILLCCFAVPAFSMNETEAKLEYNKGVDLYKIGQYDKSMAAFRHAIELNPDLTDAYYNLGSILTYLNQDEEALNVFKQIIVRNPEDYESIYKAAELSKKLGKTDKAKTYLAMIPSDSYLNTKAKELAKSMNTDLQTIRKANGINENKAQPAQNGIYENIASPTGITTDNEGNLFVAVYSDNLIYKITPKGERVIFIKDKRINGPIGLISDLAGNIYVANYNENNILKISKNGQMKVLLSNILRPYGLHISNGTLFVSSQGENAVIRYKL